MRSRVVSLGALMLAWTLSACAGDSTATVTNPASEPTAAATRLHLEPVGGSTSGTATVEGWMGGTVSQALRVRVVNERGRPVAGVAVRFAMGDDTLQTTVTDEAGLAHAGALTLPTGDSLFVERQVRASLAQDASQSATVTVRAWRDLSHFGGDARAELASLPLDRRAVGAILPLGTFGLDDGLPAASAMLLVQRAGDFVVRAPADGLITEQDVRRGVVTLRVRDQVLLRLAGFSVSSTAWVGREVRVGDALGVLHATGPDDGVAVRVQDATLGNEHWVRPDRYGARTFTTFFARYLADSVRSPAYALVRRAAPDLDGRIDYDRDGHLVGTWFDASAPVITVGAAAQAALSPFVAVRPSEFDPSEQLAPVALTFAYDAERPGQVRIAFGSALAATLGIRGARAVAWEDPDPATVEPSRGRVQYRLFETSDDERLGRADRVLLVQMVDAHSVRVEVVSATGTAPIAFSERARTFVR